MKLKANCWAIVTCLTFALVSLNSAFAQTLTNFKTSAERVPVNTPVTAMVEFKEADRNWCGFYIDWGDGKEPQSFRIGRKPDLASPVTRKRSFDKPGTYTLKAYGALVSKGLQSAEKCEGTLAPINIVVFDPASNSASGQTSSDKSDERRSAPQEAKAQSAAKTDEPRRQEREEPKDPMASLRLNPEEFVLFFKKTQHRQMGEPSYSTVKKLDGSRVFSSPDELKGARPDVPRTHTFCPIFLSSSFSKEQTVLLNAALPPVLNKTFKEMGVDFESKFEATQCVGDNGIGGLMIQIYKSSILVVQKSALKQVTQLHNFNLYEEGAIIGANVLPEVASELVKETVESQKKEGKRKEELNQLASGKSKEKIGSLTLSYPDRSGPLKICARKDPDANFRLAVAGYLATDNLRLSKAFLEKAAEVKSTIDRSKSITSAFTDLDDFYVNFQKDPTLCQVLIDYPENLQTIATAVGEGKYELNPLVSIDEARNDIARRRGFADVEAYEFAREIEANADTIKRFSDLGIKNREDFKATVARMQQQKYSEGTNWQEVLSFLEDERAGAAQKKSAKAVKMARDKARADAEKRAIAERLAMEAERNKPLTKSKLKTGTSYKWYHDGSCTDSSSEQCLNINQYKQICGWASGLTVQVRGSASVAFRYPYSKFLKSGGEMVDLRYGWNSQVNQCRVSWAIVGVFNGTNVRETFSGYASNFIRNSGGILIHSVSTR